MIRLVLPSATDVRVTISHVSGRTLVNEQFADLSEGLHVLRYSSAQWEKGIYLVRIQSGARVIVRKILRM